MPPQQIWRHRSWPAKEYSCCGEKSASNGNDPYRGSQATGSRFVQRWTKRSWTAILESNKTRDYSRQEIVNAWPRFPQKSENVQPSEKIPVLLRHNTGFGAVLLQVHHQQLGFGHFFDGIAQ